MNIRTLGLENFRKFKDYQEFKFKPITILVGPNNSGKSALLKALLLLQDNVGNKFQKLKFGSDTNHRILSFEHAKNIYSVNSFFRIKCEFDPVGFDIEPMGGGGYGQVLGASTIDISFEKDLKTGVTKVKSIELFDQQEKPINDIEGQEGKLDYTSLAFGNLLHYTPPYRSIGLKEYSKEKFRKLSENLKEFNSYQAELVDFFVEQNNFIRKWCDSKDGFDIGDLQVVENGNSFEIKLSRNNREIDLSYLGTGSAQILAIILEIGLKSKEEIVVLEEPETNLHPKYQSKLADMIVDGTGPPYGTQFIIETHSEYLIRRLQYIIAKAGKTKVDGYQIKSEDIQIYYFSDNENEAPKALSIEKDGSLSGDFGKGFFDEAPYLITELWKAQRN